LSLLSAWPCVSSERLRERRVPPARRLGLHGVGRSPISSTCREERANADTSPPARSPVNVVGLYHDAAACLVHNGRLVAAAQEEVPRCRSG
jgi:hypothetical protein